MDRFTLFVCLYTNGYISGWAISNQEPLRGVQYTPHVKRRIKRKVFYMYSIAPHINEFSSSWRFFFFLVADLILLDAIERKLLFSWGYEMSGRM